MIRRREPDVSGYPARGHALRVLTQVLGTRLRCLGILWRRLVKEEECPIADDTMSIAA